ncbi:hypothetical protein VYU27_009007 [Nannochloropsis oceanica]
MAAGRRTVVAGGRSSGINEEGGAGEVKKRGNGGGAAAMPMPCTPEKPRAPKAPAAPIKRGGVSHAVAAVSEGSKPAPTPCSTSASSSSSCFPSLFTLLFLVVAAAVLSLSFPAIYELKQIVQMQGLSEREVRKIVVETMESQTQGHGRGRRQGPSPKINKEDVRQVFRDLMKEEGAALLGPALQPLTAAAAAAPPPPPPSPAIDDNKLQKCSADKTVKLWKPAASSSTRGSGKAGTKGSTPSSPKASYTEVASLSVHASDVTALAIQATGHYFASASKDKTWALHDASSGQCLAHVVDPAIAGGYECLAFHPDGVLLGTGTTASKVRMWDVKTQANVATFEDHTGPVSSLSFSENGYYMASGAADGTVKLWDLRKLKSIRSLDLGEGVQAVAFDPSGQYLGVAAGTGIKVYLAKAWSPVAEFNDHSDKITALKFGHPASAFLATASLDRTVKVYH